MLRNVKPSRNRNRAVLMPRHLPVSIARLVKQSPTHHPCIRPKNRLNQLRHSKTLSQIEHCRCIQQIPSPTPPGIHPHVGLNNFNKPRNFKVIQNSLNDAEPIGDYIPHFFFPLAPFLSFFSSAAG